MATPSTLAELARYTRPRALRWEPPTALVEPRRPAAEELEILVALGALGVLSTVQIHRRFLGGLSARGLRHRLRSMAEQGWLRRGHLLCAGPGQTPRICALTDAGGRLVGAGAGPDPFPVEWDDLDGVVHALHVAAWWLAFERIAGRHVGAMRRPRSADWKAPDLELRMVPGFGALRLLVAVLPRRPRVNALKARLDRLQAWSTDGSTTTLLVLPDETTAIAVARALVAPAYRVHLTSEPEIHHGRLRALTRVRSEVALVDLLGPVV